MDGNDLELLRAHLRGSGGRMYLGRIPGGLALSDPEQAVLVLGPPRSGKTTAMAVPNVMAAPGPVVATSTKMDVLSSTWPSRSHHGRGWLLDPSGSVPTPSGLTRLRWSPAASAATWDDSLVLARAMSRAARPESRTGEAAHWVERAEALLAPLLHAGNLDGGGIESVLRWVLRHDLAPAQTVLVTAGANTAVDVLCGIESTDPREQSGIWSSAAGILSAYRSDAALDNAAPANFDPRTFVTSSDTVYVCAPSRQQDLLAPIIVGFIEQVRASRYAECAAHADAHAAPLTLVLDELANIAPLPDLPSLVSEGGSQGVLTLACLQDLSQARSRWGAAADGFLSLFGAKLVMPGIADMQTLELVSKLGGELDVPARGTSRAPWWTREGGPETVTWSPRRQRRLPIDAVSTQEPGSTILISGSRPPEKVRTPPWWASRPFMEARDRSAVDRGLEGRSTPGLAIDGRSL